MSTSRGRRPNATVLRAGSQVLAAVLLVVGVLSAYYGMVVKNPFIAIGGFIVMGLTVGFLTAPLTKRMRASRGIRRP